MVLSPRPDRIVMDDPGYQGEPWSEEKLAAWWALERDARRMIGLSIARAEGWPLADLRIPPPPMRGRMVDPPLGQEEGELCMRTQPGFGPCFVRLELRHGRGRDGCYCRIIQAPCGYCMSEVPECPSCGWRAEEP